MIDEIMIEYTNYSAIALRAVNDQADDQAAYELDPMLSQHTLSQIVYALRKNLGNSGIAGTTIPAASADRAAIKSGSAGTSAESDGANIESDSSNIESAAGAYVP